MERGKEVTHFRVDSTLWKNNILEWEQENSWLRAKMMGVL